MNHVKPPETHPSLIVRIKGPRNERAWGEFVLAYEPFLRHLVQRQGVPERHVPDMVQQVLLGIARSVDEWHDDGGEASFRRWLSRVARNVAIKFMSRERKQVGGRGGTEFLELLEQTPEPASNDQIRAYEHELVVWAAEQVRSEFRDTSWRAFWGTLVEGRSVAEMAQELGVSPGSIYMSRGRIMARIQGKIKDVIHE